MSVTTVHCSDGTPLEIHWPREELKSLPFVLESEHWTYPACPMDIWLDPFNSQGMMRAFDEVSLRQTIVAVFAGPFQYGTFIAPEGERLAETIAAVGELLRRYGSAEGFWREFCEVRAREAVHALGSSLRSARLADVADTLGYGLAQTFTSLMPLFGAMMPLRMMLERQFGPEGNMLADEVTQGGVNASQAVDGDIAALAGLAGATREVTRILTEEGTADRLAALRREPAARPFMERFDALIARHNDRSFGWELLLPTWGEDPGAVLAMVAAHVRAGGAPDVGATSRARREAATARVIERLPESDRDSFRSLVRALDGLVGIREDRAYWQMRLTGAVRLLLLARGESLARAGTLARPDDVLFLSPGEFEGTSAGDLSALVSQRRADWTRARTLAPPPFLGPPPADSPPRSESERELRGYPGSRGVVTGLARIVHSPEDIDRFEAGDILVCRITTPAWTPLIGLAGALVTETGSPSSHPAIAAREYGIPCVLSVERATEVIADGQVVTVDGEAGTVVLGG